jgi:hypothetical protein
LLIPKFEFGEIFFLDLILLKLGMLHRPTWQHSTTSKTTTAERRSSDPRRRLQEGKRRDRRRRPHRPRPELGFSPGEHEALNAGELGAPQRCLQKGERRPGASSSPAPTESGRAFTRSTILPRRPSPAGQTKHAGQQDLYLVKVCYYFFPLNSLAFSI